MLVFRRLCNFNVRKINSLYAINTCEIGYSRRNKKSRVESMRIHYSGCYFDYQYVVNKKTFKGKIIKTHNLIFFTFNPNSILYQFNFIENTFKLSSYNITIDSDPNFRSYTKRFFKQGSVYYATTKKQITILENMYKNSSVQYQYVNNKIRVITISHISQNRIIKDCIKKLIITVIYRDQTIDNIFIKSDKGEKIKYVKY